VVGVGGREAGDVRRAAVGVRGRTANAAIVLGALRAGLRIEDALEATDRVGRRERRAVREDEIRSEMKDVAPAVGGDVPALGQHGHDLAGVVVA
jgi:hypothetical protein